MKVSHDEIHTRLRGWDWGRGRVVGELCVKGDGMRGGEAGCFWVLVPHLPYCHSDVGQLVFLPPSTYLWFFIACFDQR